MAGIRVHQKWVPMQRYAYVDVNDNVQTDVCVQWEAVNARGGYVSEKTVSEDEALAYMIELEKVGFEIFMWDGDYIIIERCESVGIHAVLSRIQVWLSYTGTLDEYPHVEPFVAIPLP